MKSRLLAIALFLLAGLANVAQAQCHAQYLDGTPPLILNRGMADQTTPLCFEAFAVMHSGVTRTPLWSAEHLTKTNLNQARSLKRVNSFHPEEKLPGGFGAELKDYSRSGYDRGHMSPSGDMPSTRAQYESFTLANMIPQDADSNQNLWEGIESSTRTLAKNRDLYVISGPLFEGNSLQRINGRVLVPTSIFKAIYDPQHRQAAAYIAPNAPGMAYKTVSIAELEQRIGINLFPSLPESVKRSKMPLPEPTPHGYNTQSEHISQYSSGRHHAGYLPAGYTAYRLAKHLLR